MHRSYANNLVQSRTSSKDRLGFPEHLDQPSSTKPIYSNFMKKRKIRIKPQQEPLLSRLRSRMNRSQTEVTQYHELEVLEEEYNEPYDPYKHYPDKRIIDLMKIQKVAKN
jgi:hypothetical protein